MKIKTSELIGEPLDHAVAIALGINIRRRHGYMQAKAKANNYQGDLAWLLSVADNSLIWADSEGVTHFLAKYSTDWAEGGPILDREGISSIKQTEHRWVSEYSLGCDRTDHARAWGSTPLIAAMRTYVTSKLGEEVEIPEESA